jgi:hypothetical protein
MSPVFAWASDCPLTITLKMPPLFRLGLLFAEA